MVFIIRDCVISGFRREVEENCALSGCYAASSGQFLIDDAEQHIGPIFEDKNLKMGPTDCKELAAIRCVITQKSAVLMIRDC
jgi:hypothetical protein